MVCFPFRAAFFIRANRHISAFFIVISSLKEDIEPVQCWCGLTTKIMTSTTTKNPGRRFYGCAMHKKVL
jgi:hypothetical protein